MKNRGNVGESLYGDNKVWVMFQNVFWNYLKVAETHSAHTEKNEASFRVVLE